MKHQGGLSSRKIRAWKICHSPEESIKGNIVTMTQIDVLKLKKSWHKNCHADGTIFEKKGSMVTMTRIDVLRTKNIMT